MPSNGRSRAGTSSSEYTIGVRKNQAVIKMLRKYCTSRKYTWTAASTDPRPKVKTICSRTSSGSMSMDRARCA